MSRKFLTLSLLLAVLASSANATIKSESNIKDPAPQNNPWDPRNSVNANEEDSGKEAGFNQAGANDAGTSDND